MWMPMMNIGIVWVRMLQPVVPVSMRVWLSDGIVRRVRVLMVEVMRMCMLVSQGLVDVPMLVTFAYVQPDSCCHQSPCRQQPASNRFTPQNDTGNTTDKRCHGKVIAGACRAEFAQSADVQDQTQTVTDEADHAG